MALARHTGRLAALALISGLLVTTGAGSASAADAVDGAQTSGDVLFPNQGNGGYDAKHYDIDLKVNVVTSPTSNAVGTTSFPAASATMQATTTGAPLKTFSMDFQGSTGNLAAATLNVDSVTVNGEPADFTRIENTTTSNATTDKHKLVVTPATPVDGNFTAVVKYSGSPVAHTDTDGSSEGWNNTTDGATFLNQPIGAMTAFPHNNTPRDKATWTFTVDVPSKLKTSNQSAAAPNLRSSAVASNGELVSQTPNGDGSRTTWVWDQKKQMASELSMISIGRYDVYTSNITLASGRTIPEWTFIDPAISVANQTTTLSTRAQQKSIIDFYETKYGPYPGNSTGLVTDVVPSAINYALETQDRSFFPNAASRGTTYHEIMHQWWGDNVSPDVWNDIWLNEGPAQYSEWQFPYEGAGTPTTTTEQQAFALYTTRSNGAGAPWNVAPAAMTQASQLFGSQSYERGAFTLEALRTSIGAANFEKLMREEQLENTGKSRKTTEFIARAEAISGRDLSAFFNTWIYTSGRPAWPFKFNLNIAGPTTQVNGGDTATYTVTARNTGKVAMTAGQAVVKINVDDLLDEAILVEPLPANVTQDGGILTWSVPATALAATSSVSLPVTVRSTPDKTGDKMVASVSASSLGGTCVTCSSTVTIGTAPISPAPVPTITGGTPTVDQALAASTDGWATGTAFAYQWMIDGTPVPGATSATYTPTGDVIGLPVTVKVTGTLDGFNPTSATSAATPVGVRATQPAGNPTISGTPKIGSPLTVSNPGTWADGTVFTYTWSVNGSTISGATGPTYTPALASQVGQPLAVLVAGTRFGYTTSAKLSAATAPVAAGDPIANPGTPTTSTPVRVGTAVQGYAGDWDAGTTFAFRWLANGTTVSTASTQAAYTPTAAVAGQSLVFEVTGTKPGVTGTTVRSTDPVTIAAGVQTLQPTPTITGTGKAQSTLTGVPGTWDTGTTLSYKWLVDGTSVSGATTTSFTPTIDQVGKDVTFEVTSTRTGYTTVTKTSAAKTVLGAAQTLTPTPTITGTPKVNVELTGVPGTWDDGTTLTYQWLADGNAVADATGLTFTPSNTQAGKPITFAVTSTKTGYETVTKTSDPTDNVADGVFDPTPVPTITGTPKVGSSLTAVPGDWDSKAVLSYQWLADGTAVEGATLTSFAPGADQVGQAITVAVTGSKSGYTSVTKTSDPTDDVAAGTFDPTPVPVISGTPQVGAPLTAAAGDWDSKAVLTYQWFADGDPVDGATGTTFTPQAAQLGDLITVKVTGTKAGYDTVTKTSAATAAVAEGDLTDTPTPTITGTPKVGTPLTAVPGDWDDDADLTFQWFADGDAVTGATDDTFTPEAAQLGDPITVKVTGTRTGYTPVTKTSEATDGVAPGDLTDTPTPTITGTPKVGVELTAGAGDWDTGTTLTYQWLADGDAITGATDDAFTPKAAQLGKVVTVAVTGTKAGYTTVTKTSDPTDEVAAGDLTDTPTPTITGTPQVGVELAAVTGDWDDDAVLTYQWLADDVAITGATGATYTPRAGQSGKAITVAVTGTKSGYTTVTRTSDPTDDVAPGGIAPAPVPTITGTAKVGVELTGVVGTWDEDADLSYQWLVDGDEVDGETSTTYTPQAGDVGKAVTFAVTGEREDYTTITQVSVPTEDVVVGDIDPSPVPTITGTAQVGSELTGVVGTWDEDADLSYQWFVGGTEADGQTGLTYTPTAGTVGQEITFAVTGERDGYETVTRVSDPTDEVANGTITPAPEPTITGTAQVGKTLTGVAGTWAPGTALTYKWMRDGRPIPGATETSYTATYLDRGLAVTFQVTGTKGGYTSVSKVSAGKRVVTGVQTLHPAAKIYGTTKVGNTLHISYAKYDTGVYKSYAWYVNGKKVSSASTLPLKSSYAGKKVRVAVTAKKTGYYSFTSTSGLTSAIKK